MSMDNDTDFPHLPNAPITEALIDIQVRFHIPPTNKTLQSVADLIKEEFPLIEERYQAAFSFNIKSKESESSIEQEPLGFLMRTEDKQYAAQIMSDRFTFSRLTPYIDWNDLREQTERIWSIYRDTTNPDRIVRLAVRYINRLLLPSPIEDFNDYFNSPIEIPSGLPQSLAGYMTRLVIPDPKSGAVATVQQVLEGETKENHVSIIFDIDTFKIVDMDINNEDEVWSNLEALREYKNRIFFKSLKENTIKLYQ